LGWLYYHLKKYMALPYLSINATGQSEGALISTGKFIPLHLGQVVLPNPHRYLPGVIKKRHWIKIRRLFTVEAVQIIRHDFFYT